VIYNFKCIIPYIIAKKMSARNIRKESVAYPFEFTAYVPTTRFARPNRNGDDTMKNTRAEYAE
jgi:hypothetical protein